MAAKKKPKKTPSKTIALAEARAQFSEIASELAQAGEGEVIVTRYGRALVKIVPAERESDGSKS
jgi:prevent-host-death family protein